MADSEGNVKRIAIVVGGIVGVIGLLLFIVLFPMSFSYLDFYEVSYMLIDSKISLEKINIIFKVWFCTSSNNWLSRYE